MLNFEEEFNKLLENDPLGLLKEKLKVSAVISRVMMISGV